MFIFQWKIYNRYKRVAMLMKVKNNVSNILKISISSSSPNFPWLIRKKKKKKLSNKKRDLLSYNVPFFYFLLALPPFNTSSKIMIKLQKTALAKCPSRLASSWLIHRKLLLTEEIEYPSTYFLTNGRHFWMLNMVPWEWGRALIFYFWISTFLETLYMISIYQNTLSKYVSQNYDYPDPIYTFEYTTSSSDIVFSSMTSSDFLPHLWSPFWTICNPFVK